jgi:hypothetical protein
MMIIAMCGKTPQYRTHHAQQEYRPDDKCDGFQSGENKEVIGLADLEEICRQRQAEQHDAGIDRFVEMTDQFVTEAKSGAPCQIPQRGADKVIENPGQ